MTTGTLEHVAKTEKYRVEGYNLHTLDITSKGLTEPVQLISSKEGKALQEDINALYNSINK